VRKSKERLHVRQHQGMEMFFLSIHQKSRAHYSDIGVELAARKIKKIKRDSSEHQAYL
jgi:hypothetical protein